MRLVVVSFVGLLAAACTQSAEQKTEDVCTAFCDCSSASPAKVQECMGTCTQAPSFSDACLDCVYTNSQTCAVLFNDCTDTCFPSNLPSGGN
jgi:hypothetical protein